MGENINALIVDDEFQSRKLVVKMLSRFSGQIHTVREAGTIKEAIISIEIAAPQLIFLDIQMQKENGFELLDKLPANNFEVIFITAHHEFAVKAFRYNAIDYLLKPVDADEFQAAVTKALNKIRLTLKNSQEQIRLLKQQWKNPNRLPDRLIIPTAEGYMVVPVKDISYCHANSNYTEFYLTNKTKLISGYTMGQYEDILAEHDFFRIHRSYIINLAHIKMYKKGEGGIVIMNDGKEIEVSRSNKESFMKFFKG